ncbi:membrane dipeptidase [Paramixta manurensis]|uniref:Membrane dipeptidase n=1 Tax=Paramixta manurensis TaxID=2740817 RepID=A0A6M8U3K8_9GAMM|nr:membrane dipeptidase [Erwiniaceae bacterium PD-1]
MSEKKPMPVFDGHNDLLLRLWLHAATTPPEQPFFNGEAGGHIDFPRLRRGGMVGGLFAVFVPPADYVAQARKEAVGNHQPLAIVEAQIAILQRLESAAEGRAKICRTVAEIEHCLANNILAMVMHIEGAEALDPELKLLDRFWQLGLRSLGPFWNTPNQFGVGVSGGFPGSPDSGEGLTAAGRALLQRCNQLGIMIDLSHMNEKAFWQTAEISQAPLVATHSNAHALCPQPRNLTDRQLAAIAASDGLVGVNFGTAFLRADGKRDGNTPITEIVKHLAWLIDKLGEDRVGFGSDFDGINVPDELGDVAGLPLLLQALTQAGFSEAVIEKLAWRNWLRVLKQTWGR